MEVFIDELFFIDAGAFFIEGKSLGAFFIGEEGGVEEEAAAEEEAADFLGEFLAVFGLEGLAPPFAFMGVTGL